ncbi:MAG TPA: 2,3-diaminopropionate biosynthesis protein SbnA [Roseiflexaceae bacterium]|nr:2,3-diaminopropionate biosynthesis protein SbnA [Roseiflexaceae bacterium]
MHQPCLLERICALLPVLQDTPTVRLDVEGVNLYAKLEGQNPVGSIKDRPAIWVLKRAAERGELHEGSTLVESSSGNFASALASYAKLLNLKFIPVIDPNITPAYESFLQRTCEQVVKVTEHDDLGGFLKTRLKKVQELRESIKGAYWTNQYGNLDVIEAHYALTGEEIRKAFKQLDYVFIGVSTGGTIAGVSRRLKEAFPSVQVVAVDAEGSVIFGGAARKRYIPGIGAGTRPDLVNHAIIDDVVLIPEHETVYGCRELLQRHGLLVGGSSGSCYAAVKRYLPRFRASCTPPTVLFLCADRGTAYMDTLFNPSWVSRFIII